MHISVTSRDLMATVSLSQNEDSWLQDKQITLRKKWEAPLCRHT
jgi:hypothetical protein